MLSYQAEYYVADTVKKRRAANGTQTSSEAVHGRH